MTQANKAKKEQQHIRTKDILPNMELEKLETLGIQDTRRRQTKQNAY